MIPEVAAEAEEFTVRSLKLASSSGQGTMPIIMF